MGKLTVKVPDVGEGIAEVELVSWAVAEGETVERNQIIAEVMTDKATVEVPAPVDGVISAMTGGVGDVLLVGSPLFAVETEGEYSPEAEPAPDAPAPVTAAAQAPPQTVTTQVRPVGRSSGAARAEGRTPTATPAVRRRAREGGIDLRTVAGSGPAGRITHEDLDAVFAGAGGPGLRPGVGGARHSSGLPSMADPSVTDEPIVGLRRRIADQMVASSTTIPHITYVEEIDMTALEELRKTLNDRAESGPKLTLLPFLIRALVNELPNFRSMNAHVLDPVATTAGGVAPGGETTTGGDRQPSDRQPAMLRTFGGVHVGVATQTDSGLVVPVIHHAEAETLWTTAQRIIDLAEAARNGTARREDLTGSTITITSLGALGGLVTTPVINKPETTIIGVNKMVVRPVWIDGEFVPRKMMNLSSAFDHRVIDGFDAARFVQALKHQLEQPALLFVDRPPVATA